MKSLAVTLLLCALPSVWSHCYFKDVAPGATKCQDDVDYTWHQVGSWWTNSKCMNCTCGHCCALYSTPTKFPADCVAVFDQKTCEYKVHKKNDPSTLCPIFAAVG